MYTVSLLEEHTCIFWRDTYMSMYMFQLELRRSEHYHFHRLQIQLRKVPTVSTLCINCTMGIAWAGVS